MRRCLSGVRNSNGTCKSEADVWEEENRIFNELRGKALCIYNKLITSSTDFKRDIQRFDGEFPVSHLRFKSENMLGTKKGSTTPLGLNNTPNYYIDIHLNSANNIYGYHQRPNLMVVKTIAHEVIHAGMFRKLMSLARRGNLSTNNWSVTHQVNYVNSIKKNFPGIYDYYRRHKNWQHQQMATHYRSTIADILRDFDTNQHSRQFYMDLAWGGVNL